MPNPGIKANKNIPLVYTQQNGPCPLNTTDTVRVMVYQKPEATVLPGDSLVYFRQFMPMWADSLGWGTGLWATEPGWQGGDITHPQSHRAVVDLGGENLDAEVQRTLTWTVSNGICQDDQTTVQITRRDLVMHTAFSPNGDLYNEYLIIDGLEFAEKFTMRIYSRSGMLVRTINESDVLVDPGTGLRNVVWNGRMEDDSEAEDGSYFYIIEVQHAGETYIYRNFLELVRKDPFL
jgi:gliding motility-associated-like protein